MSALPIIQAQLPALALRALIRRVRVSPQGVSDHLSPLYGEVLLSGLRPLKPAVVGFLVGILVTSNSSILDAMSLTIEQSNCRVLQKYQDIVKLFLI